MVAFFLSLFEISSLSLSLKSECVSSAMKSQFKLMVVLANKRMINFYFFVKTALHNHSSNSFEIVYFAIRIFFFFFFFFFTFPPLGYRLSALLLVQYYFMFLLGFAYQKWRKKEQQKKWKHNKINLHLKFNQSFFVTFIVVCLTLALKKIGLKLPGLRVALLLRFDVWRALFYYFLNGFSFDSFYFQTLKFLNVWLLKLRGWVGGVGCVDLLFKISPWSLFTCE
jgi:hypothetical protein